MARLVFSVERFALRMQRLVLRAYGGGMRLERSEMCSKLFEIGDVRGGVELCPVQFLEFFHKLGVRRFQLFLVYREFVRPGSSRHGCILPGHRPEAKSTHATMVVFHQRWFEFTGGRGADLTEMYAVHPASVDR